MARRVGERPLAVGAGLIVALEALFGPAEAERVGPIVKSWVCVRPVPAAR